MNIHMSISILRKTEVPTKRAEVPSIMAEANLTMNPGRPLPPEADTSHRSISTIITAAGMKDSRDRAYMLCCPSMTLSNAASQKYRGGLSAYGSPWFVSVNIFPSEIISSTIFRYRSSLAGVKSLRAISGVKVKNMRTAATRAGCDFMNVFIVLLIFWSFSLFCRS